MKTVGKDMLNNRKIVNIMDATHLKITQEIRHSYTEAMQNERKDSEKLQVKKLMNLGQLTKDKKMEIDVNELGQLNE